MDYTEALLSVAAAAAAKLLQSCPTLRDPMDCSPPGASVHGISRQEYWSGVPLPSPLLSVIHTKQKITLGISKRKN